MREFVLPMAMVAGAGLIAAGLMHQGARLKADEPLAALPERAGTLPSHDMFSIPTHTREPDEKERARATYCQLLTAYETDLALAESRMAEAKARMDRIKRQAREVCQEFAWNATWTYKYGGLFGSAGWTEYHKSQPESLRASCLEYVRGQASSPGTPSIKPPPTRGANFMDQSWHNVKQAINVLKQQVEDARALLPGLRQEYAQAKADYVEAKAKFEDLVKKIRDLKAQGVECA